MYLGIYQGHQLAACRSDLYLISICRDIDKTNFYGNVCFKLLVYTGEVKMIHEADNNGLWMSKFDSAYLPPNNHVVKR